MTTTVIVVPAVTDTGPAVPLTVSAGTPAETIVSGWVADVPPPGAGVNTVIVCDPGAARSATDITVVKVIDDTKVVARADPLTRITEAGRKLDPDTVNVNAAPPAGTDVGVIEVKTGAGGTAVTVNGALLEMPPPGAGLLTVMAWVVALATSLARMAAVTVVGET